MHFIGLDNVQYKGDGQGNYDNSRYRGYLTEQQLQWIRNDLNEVPKDKLIVIITHISLITHALDGQDERYNLGDNINTVNFDQFVEILKPFNRVYAMAGHDTSNSWKVKVDHQYNWYGDWFLAHTLAETRIVLDPLLAGTRDAENEFLAINRGQWVPGTKVVVNLFDGGERDRVMMSIDGSAFADMQNVLRTDPFMERLQERFAETDDNFSSPQPSSHIWEAVLPDLDIGLHVVRIKAKDEFGQQSAKAMTFEIIE